MPPAPEPGRSSGRLEIGTVGLGLLALGLGVVGQAYTGLRDPFDIVYRSLQLFVLDGGALADGAPLAPGGPPVHVVINPVLQIARFLAPAVTVLTLLLGVRRLFTEERRRRRIAGTTGHTIVCGDDASARVLARSLREGGAAVVLVVPPGGGAHDGPPRGVPAVVGDAREPDVLAAAGLPGAAVLYAMAGRSAVNAAVALAAGRLRTDPSRPLETFAQVRRDELVEALRVRRVASNEPASMTIDFFSVFDIAARALVVTHPPGPGPSVVMGFGELGQAVVRALLRTLQAPEDRVVVTGATREQVRAEADRTGVAGRIRDAAETPGAGTVYVCLDDEDDAVAAGLRLAVDGGRPVVVCLRRASPFAEAIGGSGALQVFGVLDAACRAGAIADDSIMRRAARAIHEEYRAQARARNETPASNPSSVPWAALPEHLKLANLRQAEHIGAKLADTGASLSTRPPATPFAFTEDEVLRLAKLEHVRWMAERRVAGFRYGPARVGNQHPDMQDWDNLGNEARQKDIDTVRRLPALLAAEGLYLRRGPAVG